MIHRRKIYLPLLFAVPLFLLFFAPSLVLADSPVIEIWYGNKQTFGLMGVPQRWVNIVGNVSDADGVATLSYQLNGGDKRPLSVGANGRRLADKGDFNIDIHVDELQVGENELQITAVDPLGNETTETVLINFTNQAITVDAFQSDWANQESIQSQGQAVDGLWAINGDGIRPIQIGYDRLYNMGDMSWDNYEVTIPVTVNSIDPVFDEVNIGSAVDVVVRWQGHSVWDDTQPAWGWWPYGAMAMYEWSQPDLFETKLAGNKLIPLATTEGFTVEFGKPYMVKIRAETMSDLRSIYSFKSWPADQTEPKDWQFFGVQREWHPLNGSILLVAHNADATFGDMIVAPIANQAQQGLLAGNSALITQLPIILVSFVGLFFAWRYRKNEPKVALVTAVSLILVIIHATVGTTLGQQLTYFLHGNGMGTHRIGYGLGGFYFLQSALVALVVLLLVTAVFKWHQS